MSKIESSVVDNQTLVCKYSMKFTTLSLAPAALTGLRLDAAVAALTIKLEHLIRSSQIESLI